MLWINNKHFVNISVFCKSIEIIWGRSRQTHSNHMSYNVETKCWNIKETYKHCGFGFVWNYHFVNFLRLILILIRMTRLFPDLAFSDGNYHLSIHFFSANAVTFCWFLFIRLLSVIKYRILNILNIEWMQLFILITDENQIVFSSSTFL